MSKQATFVVFTKKQIENIIIDHTRFGGGKVRFTYLQNKLNGCVIVKHPIEESVTDYGTICIVAEYSRKEIDDILIEYKKQEDGGRTIINYYSRDIINTKNVVAEHLFDIAIVRYGVEIELDQATLTELSIIPPQQT